MERETLVAATPVAEDATTFVGRGPELALARRVLGTSRLLTITGPIGVGKSRFAARLVEQLGRGHRDGVRRLEPRRTLDARVRVEPSPSVADSFSGILLLDAADDHDDARALVERLLHEVPGACLVVTSTRVLGAAGEHVLELPALRYPPRGRASVRSTLEWDAPRLLVDRIVALQPGFAPTPATITLLRDICAECDGLPASIELAAAATRFLPLESVRDGLRSADSLADLLPAARSVIARAESLVAASDDLERRLLSVAWMLREPLTLECLPTLVDDDAAPSTRTATVAAFCDLVDRSILMRDPDVDGAFRAVRAVARAAHARADLDEHDLRRRIDAHVVAAARAFAAAAGDAAEPAAARHLLQHRRGLEALLERQVDDPALAAQAIDLIVALRRQWTALGLVPQARAWLERAIASRPLRDASAAEALRCAAFLSVLCGDASHAAELSARSTRYAVRDGEALRADTDAMPAEFLEALVHAGRLDLEQAECMLEGVVERTRRSPRTALLAEQRYFLTLVRVMRGDHDGADREVRASVAWMRARGNRWGIAHSLVLLSISLMARGLDERASETAREALLMMDAMGDRAGVPTTLRLLAVLASRAGDAERAAVLLAGASRMDSTRTLARDAFGDGVEGRVRRALGPRPFARLASHGRRLGRSELVRIGSTAAGLEQRAGTDVLTRREREVAELLVEGLSNAQIAARLVLSTRTVEGHIQRTLHKLEFRSRSQIAVWMTTSRLDHELAGLAS
ncbi:LuxR family transcriptional regulator [Agrococcus versicolor]|uniref:LuxR family transcriptional regulator n=1 Tax=Agrococcus versicolor TaxID=501482 RepID=A0ABN3AXG9_9MICO